MDWTEHIPNIIWNILPTIMAIIIIIILSILISLIWLLKLIFWITIATIILWLISLTGTLPFNWINAILLGFALKILTQILPIKTTAPNN